MNAMPFDMVFRPGVRPTCCGRMKNYGCFFPIRETLNKSAASFPHRREPRKINGMDAPLRGHDE